MTARTTLVLAVLLLVAGPGCKRAPRFKSRSLGAPTSSLRTARALSHLGGSLDDGLSDSYTRAQLDRTVAVEAGVATTRRHGAEGRVTVRVELDALEPQVVGQASQVALVDDVGRETTVPWATFAAKAKADLAPVVVDGNPVPRLFRLDAGFRWPVAGSRAGRQAMVVPQRSMD